MIQFTGSKLYYVINFDTGVHLKKAITVHKHIQPAISLRESSGSGPGVSEFPSKPQFSNHKARHRRVEYDGTTPWTEHEAPSTDSSLSRGRHVR